MSLFGVAAILFICSIFWTTIGENWVGLKSFLQALIANYFGFRAVGIVIFLIFCFDFAIKMGWISINLDNTIINKDASSESDSVDGRVFVDATPAYLTGLLKDKLEIHGQKLVEPYTGKWLSVTGAVKDVYYDSVVMRLDPLDSISAIFLHFDIKWKDRIHTLRENQQISVIEKIVKIELRHLTMVHCELIVNR